MTIPIILASASPRRRQLLEMLGIAVVVRPSKIPEILAPGESPAGYSARLARAKASAVTGDLVLAADTIVVLQGEVLEKPDDRAHALTILRKLQGQTHQVVTSVALKYHERIDILTDTTDVTFRSASDETLAAYIETGEPMDKAGAYGIQGFGAALVERVEGDFFGVMGLPVRLVLDLLTQAGIRYVFGEGLTPARPGPA
ncbi:MAG: Maf family protein [Gemmatimonadota bacterium]